MKQNIKLGVIALARNTFDFVEAEKIYNKTLLDLKSIENCEIIAGEKLVFEVDETIALAKKIAESHVDGIVIISATFHLGHLALAIKKIFENTPTLLWAFTELPYDGGKIRLNSVCGLNLNASNLYKGGYDGYICHVGDYIDEDFVNAVRMKTKLSNSRVGMVGYHANGFFNLGVEALSPYRNFGVLVDHFELEDFFSKRVDKETIEKRVEKIKKDFICGGITDKQVYLLANLVESAKAFMDENKLNAVAVRCWPEHAKNYGISPCAAMAILQDEGYILGCEGDIEGTLSMLALSAISSDVPFLADLSSVDYKEDFALMWHCGVAAKSLCDNACPACLDTYFAGGKGVTTDFSLKQGEITVARFDTARNNTRLFAKKGMAIYTKKELKGTYSKVKFDIGTKELLDKVVYTGVAHHVAYVYGDYTKSLYTLAKICGFEVL